MTAPFIYQRRVAFGECDPARVYYSPRAVDYAVEAVEAWFEEVLGVTWADLIRFHRLETRFVRAECDYRRFLSAGDVIGVVVAAEKCDPEALRLSAVAKLGAKETCFSVVFQLCLFDAATGNAAPLPEMLRTRVDAYRSLCEAIGPVAAAWEEPLAKVHPSRGYAEGSSSGCPAGSVPFRREHRVCYGECGISGKIHPPKLLECAIETVGEWYGKYLGISWLEQCLRQRGTPFLNIRFEYPRPVALGERIALTVGISRLGRSSIAYEVIGYDARGERCFAAWMAACYISEESGTPRPIPFPAELRGRILAYRESCQGAKPSVGG